MLLFLNNVIQGYLNFLFTWIIVSFLFHFLFSIELSIKWKVISSWIVTSSVQVFWSIWRLSHLLKIWSAVIFSVNFVRNLSNMKRLFICRFMFLLSDLCQWCFKLCWKKLWFIIPRLKCKSILERRLVLALSPSLMSTLFYIWMKFIPLYRIFVSICPSNKLIIQAI